MRDDVQHSAGGIVLHEGNVLLIEARRTSRWQLPKGHLESGETPQDAAVREVREETGAAVTVLEPAGEVEYRFRGPHGRWIFKHVDFYLCAFAHQVSHRCDPREVSRACWHPWERALELLAFANERQLVRTALERLTAKASETSEDCRLLAAPTTSNEERDVQDTIESPGTVEPSSTAATQPRGDTDGSEEIP